MKSKESIPNIIAFILFILGMFLLMAEHYKSEDITILLKFTGVVALIVSFLVMPKDDDIENL